MPRIFAPFGRPLSRILRVTTVVDGSIEANVPVTAVVDGSIEENVPVTEVVDGSFRANIPSTTIVDGTKDRFHARFERFRGRSCPFSPLFPDQGHSGGQCGGESAGSPSRCLWTANAAMRTTQIVPL